MPEARPSQRGTRRETMMDYHKSPKVMTAFHQEATFFVTDISYGHLYVEFEEGLCKSSHTLPCHAPLCCHLKFGFSISRTYEFANSDRMFSKSSDFGDIFLRRFGAQSGAGVTLLQGCPEIMRKVFPQLVLCSSGDWATVPTTSHDAVQGPCSHAFDYDGTCFLICFPVVGRTMTAANTSQATCKGSV